MRVALILERCDVSFYVPFTFLRSNNNMEHEQREDCSDLGL